MNFKVVVGLICTFGAGYLASHSSLGFPDLSLRQEPKYSSLNFLPKEERKNFAASLNIQLSSLKRSDTKNTEIDLRVLYSDHQNKMQNERMFSGLKLVLKTLLPTLDICIAFHGVARNVDILKAKLQYEKELNKLHFDFSESAKEKRECLKKIKPLQRYLRLIQEPEDIKIALENYYASVLAVLDNPYEYLHKLNLEKHSSILKVKMNF